MCKGLHLLQPAQLLRLKLDLYLLIRSIFRLSRWNYSLIDLFAVKLWYRWMFALVFPVQEAHCVGGGSSTSILFFSLPLRHNSFLVSDSHEKSSCAKLTERENKFAATYRAFQSSSVWLHWRNEEDMEESKSSEISVLEEGDHDISCP